MLGVEPVPRFHYGLCTEMDEDGMVISRAYYDRKPLLMNSGQVPAGQAGSSTSEFVPPAPAVPRADGDRVEEDHDAGCTDIVPYVGCLSDDVRASGGVQESPSKRPRVDGPSDVNEEDLDGEPLDMSSLKVWFFG